MSKRKAPQNENPNSGIVDFLTGKIDIILQTKLTAYNHAISSQRTHNSHNYKLSA